MEQTSLYVINVIYHIAPSTFADNFADNSLQKQGISQTYHLVLVSYTNIKEDKVSHPFIGPIYLLQIRTTGRSSSFCKSDIWSLVTLENDMITIF